MAALSVQHYVHPLALDSQHFLKSLEFYGRSYNHIDNTLCDLLKNVVLGIEKFLDQKPAQIVATEKTKLMKENELSTIQRIYHCTVCDKYLGKTPDKAALHLTEQHRPNIRKETRVEKKKEKKKAQQKQNENALIKLPKKAKAILMGDFEKFFTDQLQVAEKLKQIPEYQVIEDTLLTMLKKTFPDKSIKPYKFGSRITGTGTRNSDLDIYVDIGDRFNVFEQNASKETLNFFDRIYENVKKNTIDWHHIRPIRDARVPIIRMTSTKTNIECDLGFSNSLSYFNTQLLQYIFQQQPIARRLCIFMKKWLERTKLNERITTYCMGLMVIYYLQVKNLLPPIEKLQEKMSENVLVGPWIANFIEIPITDLNINVVSVNAPYCIEHIKEFCKFYASFNYEMQLVCPFFGRNNIKTKEIEGLMPERYKEFVANENSTKYCGLQINLPMVVQDPLQMNHNVAARVTKNDLKEWKDYLIQSANILAELK